MLHSKFNLWFDLEESSVTISIHHLVNEERVPFSTTFYFDKAGKLIIPPNSERTFNKATFSYLARHVKTKVAEFKEFIEDSYLRESNLKQQI